MGIALAGVVPLAIAWWIAAAAVAWLIGTVLNRYYVAAPAHESEEAAILVFEPEP